MFGYVILAVMLSGVFSFVYTISRKVGELSRNKKAGARREMWLRRSVLAPSLDCANALKKARGLGVRAGMPGRFVQQLVALTAGIAGNQVEKRRALYEIEQLRAALAVAGFVDADTDSALAEAAGIMASR